MPGTGRREPVRIVHVPTGRALAERAGVADSMLSRMVGLLGRSRLNPGEGLVITPCNAVHGFFMRFDIDVVHVDADWRVIRWYLLRRNRAGPVVRGGRHVLELPAGVCASADLAPGDRLAVEPAREDGAGAQTPST